MSVIVKQLLDEKTGLNFVPVAHWDAISNKPEFFSGDYDDLSNKPTIPSKTSDLTNDSGFITSYNECLRFVSSGNSTISLSNYGGNAPDLKYSINNGQTWTNWNYSLITLNDEDEIIFRGNNSNGFSSSNTIYSKFVFDGNGTVSASGNIMSLIDDGLCSTFTIPHDYCFYYLFYGCIGLTSAPALPATTLVNQCYYSMFKGCTGLTTLPENMLPAITLANNCYSYMFCGCSSLTSAPELPARILKAHCYRSMFSGCTNLTSAPALPATTLSSYCYHSMFSGCTNLTSAPALPVIILASYCYYGMFWGCSSLTSAPELPATTLSSYCYSNMFHGCSRLSYIKCLATSGINTNDSTSDWVLDVASSGTFIKDPNASWSVGTNGIPEKWNIAINDIHNTGTLILHESEDTVGEWNKSNTISINKLEYVDLGLPSGTLWSKFNIGANEETEPGDYYAWAETNTKSQYSWNNYKYANGSYDKLTKYCIANYGNIDSRILLFGEDDVANTTYWEYKAHIPSYDDFLELINETGWYHTSNYKNSGIEGMVFESYVNSNSIFIPFGGQYEGSSKIDADTALLWLNKINLNYSYQAETICLYNEECETVYTNRCYGLNIRPVCKNTHTTFSVGVGNSNSTRANALEVFSNGDVYIYGLNNYDGKNPTLTNRFLDLFNINFLADSEIEQEIFGFMPPDLPYYIDALYIDDFPEDLLEEILEDNGYESLEEYLEDAINDKYTAESLGINFAVPTLLTMEYDGIEYNLWKFFIGNDDDHELYGLMPANITYEELYQNSMEANINNRYCPFIAIGSPDGGIQYTEDDDLDNKYALMHVHIIDKCSRPIDESHDSSFDSLFIDNFEDYGIFNSLYTYDVDTIEDYIDTLIANTEDAYYLDSGDTFEYEGEEYRIFIDSDGYGGLVPADLTYQDLYPDSLEANSDNIKRYTSPFVATFDYNNDEILYEGIDAKQKHSTLIAVR